jgi:hypothetical protein
MIMRENLCEFCKAKYTQGSWEGSHYMTDPITFECGTVMDDKNEYYQSDDCKRKQANVDMTDYLMGLKELDDILENSPVMEMKEPEETNPFKKEVKDLLKKIDGQEN